MTDQKRVIVIGVDSYAGILALRVPDDVVIELREYAQGDMAIDGMNLDYPGVIEDLATEGVEVERGVEVGRQGDGTPIMGDQAFVRYLIGRFGMFRPGKPPSEMSPEEVAEAERTYAELVSNG
jgi:hypothetical protein